jgi:hypothetical protein
MKLEIKMVHGQDPAEALSSMVKKIKGISSIKDLRALQEQVSKEGYGVPEDMMTEEPASEEESAAHEAMPGDVQEDYNEGETENTPDDKAEKEDKQKRIKNSKHPTTVGRMMK